MSTFLDRLWADAMAWVSALTETFTGSLMGTIIMAGDAARVIAKTGDVASAGFPILITLYFLYLTVANFVKLVRTSKA